MDLLLIGRSGNGKSATGNTILGKECFQKNNDSFTKSSKPKSASGMCDLESRRVAVTVVDGLCLHDDSLGDCVRDALEALRQGNGGFTALVFVLRFGERFSADEVSLVQLARRMFGDNVVRDHGICVVTRGGDFRYAIEEGEEAVKDFNEWCGKQTGELKSLFRECQGRVVLFDNKTNAEVEKQSQVRKLLNNVLDIHAGKRYTVEDFIRIHGKSVATDSWENSAEVERKTLEKIREIRVRVDEYLKEGSLEDEEVEKALQKELGELSKNVSQTLQDKELGLKFIKQIQGLWEKVKEKRSSHNLAVQGGTPMLQSGQSQAVQPRHAGEIAQLQPNKSNPQPHNLQLLLLGRTGNGKSSTGNSILGRQAFKPSASTTSATSEVLSDSETIDGQMITIIDGPGLDDTEKTSMEEFTASLSYLEKALDLCDYGFTAIIVVLRFGFRFTKQESDAIRVMRSLLGRDVLKKYGVCLMTHGDNFEYEMSQDAEEGGAVSFREWCQAQTGDIQRLFEECNFRYVLFDNKTRDPGKMADQRRQLVSLVPTDGCYSKEEFLVACERDLVELNLELILPKLEQKINEKIRGWKESLVTIDRDCVTDDSEYFKRIESLLTDLSEFKEIIVELGQKPRTEFFIMQLDILEMEVNTKLKLRAQSSDIKSLGATGDQARPERGPAPQGSSRKSGPEDKPWPLETPPFRTGASPQGYGAHDWPEHVGAGAAVPVQPYEQVRPFQTDDASSGSEIKDVRKSGMMMIDKIYAQFKSALESTDVERFRRITWNCMAQLTELKKSFAEIARGQTCYDDILSNIIGIENEMQWRLDQRQHEPPLLPLVYPHQQGQYEDFVFVDRVQVTTAPHVDMIAPVAGTWWYGQDRTCGAVQGYQYHSKDSHHVAQCKPRKFKSLRALKQMVELQWKKTKYFFSTLVK